MVFKQFLEKKPSKTCYGLLWTTRVRLECLTLFATIVFTKRPLGSRLRAIIFPFSASGLLTSGEELSGTITPTGRRRPAGATTRKLELVVLANTTAVWGETVEWVSLEKGKSQTKEQELQGGERGIGRKGITLSERLDLSEVLE
ncbi:hypothetical protein RRG08_063928 [Elysia crispata]|uniref:Uncharacterized protein n=1 Tax=Elysia crispata TaxID=231223 RepID=A0AAE0YEZ8_9GAST|nr:hypothetical protein RRG08_063928 [Elysia crispata]